MKTKNTLKWRLSDLPTGDEVASLVEQKVITTEEAREILFNEEKEDSNKVAALKEEVKFLRELCDKLAVKSNGWTTIVREYERYKPNYPYWYNTYATALGSGTTITGAVSTTGSNLINAMYSAQNTSGSTKLLSNLND